MSKRTNTRRTYENTDYFAMVRRMVRAAGRRAGDDVDALPELVELHRALEEATLNAVEALREDGYSWAEIGERLGCTRQAAQQRYKGRK